MPSYRVITLSVDTPAGSNAPRHTLKEFEELVQYELNRGGKVAGGVNVSILFSDSYYPTMIYSQAIVYDL